MTLGERNQKRLRAALKRHRVTQAEFASRLTAIGQPTTRRQIESWLADPRSGSYRTCPAWPHLLIEAGVVWHPTRKASERRFFTPDEDEFLRRHYPNKSRAWCAAELGRSIGSITNRAGIMGIRKAHNRPGGWNGESDRLLAQYIEQGIPVQEIAKRFGVSSVTIYTRRRRLERG